MSSFYDPNTGATVPAVTDTAAAVAALLTATPQPITVTTLTATEVDAPTAAITTAAITTANVTALNVSGLAADSVQTTITASTTQTRAGGTALTKTVSNVTVVANSGDAVTLPALTAGQSCVVYNNGAHPASVFPHGAADAIDGGSAGAAVTLTNALRCLFTCLATNVIISAQLGAVAG